MAAPSIANNVFAKKVRAGLFACVKASLVHRHDADDRLQEGIAQTWVRFMRHFTATGELLPDPVLVAICRRRAVSRRDYFVPRPRTRWSLDVYEAIYRHAGPNHLVSTDVVQVHDVSGRASEPALDALDQMSRLDERERAVLDGLILGKTMREIAADTATSSPTVCRVTAQLRIAFAEVAYG